MTEKGTAEHFVVKKVCKLWNDIQGSSNMVRNMEGALWSRPNESRQR